MRYFGTDGIRGEAQVIFTPSFLVKIATALGQILNEEKTTTICIGQDPRISSNYITSTLTGILLANGINVINLGVVSTPVVSYTIIKNNLTLGIMISASHNPYMDNGIKIFGSDGKKLSEELEKNIEERIDANINYDNIQNIGSLIDGSKYKEQYIDYIKSLGCDLSTLKIALDLSNGSATEVAPQVFKALGAQVSTIGDQPDGYNINKEVGSTHIETLTKYVKENDIDFAFSYDGDVDRLMLVNKKGEVLDGDYILYILAKSFRAQNRLAQDGVVITSMANLAFKKAFEKEQIKYEECDVGDKYVMRKLDEHGLSLGGEQSGHIIIPDLLPTGDGLLTSVILAKTIINDNLDLVSLVHEIPKYPQKLVNIKVKDKFKIMENKTLLKEIEKINETIKDTGRILVRASGTENLVRVMVENQKNNTCDEICDIICREIKNINV